MSADARFEADVRGMRTEPRLITAVFRFRGSPGREQEAAQAWAFELTCYFLRGIGEQPVVTYDAGVYTVSGLMLTTHPLDRSPVTVFNRGEPSSLDFCTNPDRAARLRELYASETIRWDGRD
jgi:hypothetical protein